MCGYWECVACMCGCVVVVVCGYLSEERESVAYRCVGMWVYGE